MIPRLFAANSTDFSSNGIGPLRDGSGWSVRQTVNEEYELQFSYPRTGARFQDIVNRAIVVAKPDPISDEQAFRIYRVVKSLSNDAVTVYANHISYDLSGYPVAPFAAQDVGTAMAGLAGNLMVSSPFQMRTTKTTTAKFNLTKPCSARSVLGGVEGSILDTYRGEYEFDNFQVTLMDRRGTDRGVSIRYGKNLTTLEQDANCAQVYTAVVPYWASEQEETVVGDLIPVPGSFDYDRVLTLDLSGEFQEKPSKATINSRAKSYIQQKDLGVPDISWRIEFQTLEKSPEYKGMNLLESIYIGDTVEVVFDRMGISAKARAMTVDYDPVSERYNSVTLGRVKSDITSTIISQAKDIEKKPTKSMVYQISDQLSQAMLGINGGCVRLLDTNADGTPDELYIADNSDPAQALKVWRYNYEGWAVSKTGYEGPFIMGATLEDGLLASFVTAANLVAGTIQSADGNTFYLNLDTGLLKISSNTQLIDAEGNTQQLATKKDIEDIGEGPQGVGIQSTTAYYYLSTSSTELKDGIWSATMPTWIDGRYYWQKLKVVYTDGGEVETSPICVSGTKGNDGVGIVSVSAEYYLSTSATELAGGTWGTDVPVIEEGTYLWTRNCINYSDGQTGTTEAWCISKGIREATQSIVSAAVDTAKEYASSLVSDSQGIVMEAVSECAKSSDLVSYQESLSAQLAVIDQGIQASVSKQELLEVTDAQGEIRKFVNTVEKYLSFDTTSGVTIGEVGSNVKQVLDNDSQKIVIGGVPVQEVDAENGAQYTLVNVKNRLRLGNLVIYVEENGSLRGRRAN